jgi:hypothetical protein
LSLSFLELPSFLSDSFLLVSCLFSCEGSISLFFLSGEMLKSYWICCSRTQLNLCISTFSGIWEMTVLSFR